MTLKLTYWQDETFTALRLKFGHMFVTPELKKVPVPVPVTRPARTLPRPTRADDSEAWTWQEMVRIAGERQPSKKVSHSEEESAAERVRRRIAQRYMGGLVREHIEQDEDPKRRSLRG
ncbi:MAG: hypothetical protein EOP83_03545 [Verrucomicrobiaceae bacterium]|nr:MAG: hypothetical protein EOP83_03545 [Verrucomicrobiaceae bacterium]